jgi:hypothetical protein
MSTLTTSRTARVAGITIVSGVALAGAVGLGNAAPATTEHTLKFTASQIADSQVGNHDIAADKDSQNGKVVGYDTTDCLINVNTRVAHCDVTLARAAGTLRGRISFNISTGVATGVVTGGTRAYRGVSGTLSARAASQKTTAITVRYHS